MQRARITLSLKLLLLIIWALIPFFGNDFYTELAARTLILAIFALSLDLLVGTTGLVSLGHATYFGVAAYAVVLLSPKYAAANLWCIMPAAIGLSALSALVVGCFVLRTRGVYFIMVTLAFAQMFFFLFHDTALGGGSDGIALNHKPSTSLLGWQPFDLNNTQHLYFFILTVLVLVYVFLHHLLASPFGRVLVGIKSNEPRMVSLGFPTYPYKLAAFTIAGGLGGVAGLLYTLVFGFVTPELLAWHQSGNVLLMVILGGMGHLMGAILGALSFVAMQEIFSSWTRHWQLLMGGVIVAAVLFLPGGLVMIPTRIKTLWINKTSARP